MRFCLTFLTALFPSLASAADLHFENDILPILGRHGCNSSGCHGKAEGQGGFKLSVFAFDPGADYSALAKEGRGRRVFPAQPEESLFLRKASGRTPHGGGIRIPYNSEDYRTLRAWVAAGMPIGSPDAPRVIGIRIEPAERIMAMQGQTSLRVIAKLSDGSHKDVTKHARFYSNNEAVASVSAEGRVLAMDVPGEAAIMAGYMGEVGVFQTIIPRGGPKQAGAKIRNNFIDDCVDRKLAKLNVAPSELCDDAEFLRRIHLDLTGTLPTASAARKFLADTSKDKRARLVEALLKSPEFADLWAMRWADLLRVERQALGHERAHGYYKWIRDSIEENKPFDRFARELVTAEGPTSEVGAANFYRVVTNPGAMAGAVSQVFLGVRIACAQCHHHPFDRWSQTDYFGMVGFFAPVAARGEAVFSSGDPVTTHPRSRKPVFTHALGEKEPEANPKGDRRLLLADWMTRPDNPFFARNLANRVWAWMLGTGIVEPVDDVRATNPPSNPELLDALARFVIASKYDVKKLIGLIAASRVYQTSSRPNETNEKDERNFSRALFKRPDAEVLLDMVCQATGAPERFPGSPGVSRAVQLWDSKARHDFLKLFGRPVRATSCECERTREPSVAQVLNLLNSPDIQGKLSHEGGVVARLARKQASNAKLVEELYLAFFSRPPSKGEMKVATEHLKRHASTRRQAVEDLAWAMLNSTEFVFNH